MGLVEDDDVVAVQVAVGEHLGEEGAVGGELEAGAGRRAVVEADGVADDAAERGADFGRDALGERDGGDAAGLGADDARLGPRDVGLEQELWDL